MTKQEISLAHSPDSDDAFMFYALATGQVQSERYSFKHHLSDIETLNRQAMEGVWDVTAISLHAYPYVADSYALMSCGASVGDNYGPIVVSKKSMTPAALKGKRIAVPGKLTTAYLAMKILEPEFEEVVLPFDQILEEVNQGKVDAGLLIHEGQLTYDQHGLHCVIDLGQWWSKGFDLPLPLGANGIRRAYSATQRAEISELLHKSIQFSLDHREKAMKYSLDFARGMDTGLADRFVGMYVNDFTLDFGVRGRKAVEKLLQLGKEKGIITCELPKEIFA